MSAAAPGPGEPLWMLADRLVAPGGELSCEQIRELVEAHCRVTGGEFPAVLLEVTLELAARVAINDAVLSSDPEGAAMGWWLRSLDDLDAHVGRLVRGRVHAVRGVSFRPACHGAFERSELDPEQPCPDCVASATASGGRSAPSDGGSSS